MQDYSLAEFLRDQSCQVGVTSDAQVFKRQEATWELFTSECVYFLDQLMVLKEVIVRTMLQNAQINHQTKPRPVVFPAVTDVYVTSLWDFL